MKNEELSSKMLETMEKNKISGNNINNNETRIS